MLVPTATPLPAPTQPIGASPPYPTRGTVLPLPPQCSYPGAEHNLLAPKTNRRLQLAKGLKGRGKGLTPFDLIYFGKRLRSALRLFLRCVYGRDSLFDYGYYYWCDELTRPKGFCDVM